MPHDFVASRRRCRALLSTFAGLLLSISAQVTATAAPRPFELVLGPADAPRALRLLDGDGVTAIPAPQSTPLGSIWKLFVYTYLLDRNIPSADYQCTGRNRHEEAYCCAPGEKIGRDAALVQSCGLYFEPSRLNLDHTDWGRYWRSAGAPDWLGDLSRLEPSTEVSVVSLLQALSAIDSPVRARVMRTLQRVTLEPRARSLLASTGSRLRVKTWSWNDTRGQRIGGFAGWLVDGTPIWLRGPGTSADVIQNAAQSIARQLPAATPADDACVSVRFFNRYPLTDVQVDGKAATDGALRGLVEVRFRNGRQLSFSSRGDMRLVSADGSRHIEGRFGINDYVARVIRREATAEPEEAARALGVAIRTYLVRHADFAAGCYRIDDDSRAQRVSPQAPDRAARAAADWSDGLILNGADGRYHTTNVKPQQLSWKEAVRSAEAGKHWDEILSDAYGSGGFSVMGEDDASECKPLVRAEEWLRDRETRWNKRLHAIPGFETPKPLPRICRLQRGNPYADLGRNRIYTYGISSENDRLSIAHEYLHFGLASHPRGRDEDYVEESARQLMGAP